MPDHPSRDEVVARVDAAVKPILAELRWQRWLLLVLCAITLSPKFGGPAPPDVGQALVHKLDTVAQATRR